MRKTLIIVTILLAFQTIIKSNNNGLEWNRLKGTDFDSWVQKTTPYYNIPSLILAKVDLSDNVKYYNNNSGLYNKFNIASLSKPFTSIAILQLVEKGILSLDDPIWKYLPHTRIKSNHCGVSKIKHLLTHTSGINSGGVKIVYQDFSPGERYFYSNIGFILLKEIIENVTKQSYAEYTKENIFKPLGMNNTDASQSNGTSGIVTNIIDIVIYTKAMMNKGQYKGKRILSEYYFDLMLDKVIDPKKNFGKSYYWSLGWEVFKQNGKVEFFHKAGRWSGAASGLIVHPEKKVAYVYLSDAVNPNNQVFLRWRSMFMNKFETAFNSINTDKYIAKI